MKFQFMKEHKDLFEVGRMSQVLGVSRSGYYSSLQEHSGKRARENAVLLGYINAAHEESRGTYGSLRIHAVLRTQGFTVGKNRIARLMREHDIRAKMNRRFKVTTNSKHNYPIVENRLKQDFKAEAPDLKWASDISYIGTCEGWLYIAVVLDLFSRKVVGLAMAEHMTQELVTQSLKQALGRRSGSSDLTHHSDRGSQYASLQFQSLLKNQGISCSMSAKGNCYDNAVVESFFHTLKTELVYQTHYQTRKQAKDSIFEYIEGFYNCKRLHSYLGYMSPNEFEKSKNVQITRV
jgi:transposase InsO family protein